jgi:hypothetical protein
MGGRLEIIWVLVAHRAAIADDGSSVDVYQRRLGIARLAYRRTSFAHFRSSKMMDVIMLAIGLGFFVLSVGYCYACDRL